MKKIVFDSSVHLGQFCITDESMRIACKNSQAMISAKSGTDVVGIISFNENSWSDHIIWGLERDVQDIFYKFMDVFHSVKNIDRIPLSTQDAKRALEISDRIGLDIENALTCAVAIRQSAQEIHTWYPSLLTESVKRFMRENYAISVLSPAIGAEYSYPESYLEEYYQGALSAFQKNGVTMTKQLHT